MVVAEVTEQSVQDLDHRSLDHVHEGPELLDTSLVGIANLKKNSFGPEAYIENYSGPELF